jgi:hypothetical protein
MQRHLTNSWGNGATITLLLVAFSSGCTQVKPIANTSPPTVSSPATSPASTPKPSTPAEPASPAAPNSAAPAIAATQPKPSEQATKPATPAAPKVANQLAVKTLSPVAKVPEKAVAEKPAAPVAAAAPATPTLDLRSLEQRLRDTRAIGMMTKLSIKNQVDDLLDEFRSFYAGKVKTPITDLRQRYDLLLMKVLSLLQDSDVALASAISSSREAIWGILRDPKKFAEI